MPVCTTSTVYTVQLREDLPREVVDDYWSGPHGEYVKSLRQVVEYNQQHFSATDHGFWPATATVGTIIPPTWRTDGFAEVRFANMAALLRACHELKKSMEPATTPRLILYPDPPFRAGNYEAARALVKEYAPAGTRLVTPNTLAATKGSTP